MPDRAALEAARGGTIPDLIGPGLRLLFVGINPSLWSAATGAHFARPGNRFWPALLAAGIVGRPVDCRDGMSPADRAYVVGRGVGITNLVARATARADELTADELRAAPARLERIAVEHRPRVVAFAGISTYRTAFGDRAARPGRQARDLAGAACWVVPNPSGLNAHATLASLAADYRAAAVAAGLDPAEPAPASRTP